MSRARPAVVGSLFGTPPSLADLARSSVDSDIAYVPNISQCVGKLRGVV